MSMLRHRRDAGSEVPARLLVSAREADDVLYARRARADRRRRRAHLHARRAARAGTATPAASIAAMLRGGRARRRARLRLRPDRLRRVGRQRPRGARPRPGEHQDGALRRHWRLTMEHLDGNAAAGDLGEIFALRADDRDRDLRRLRRDRAGGRRCTSTSGHGHRAALPGLRRGAAAAGRARAARCGWRCAASRLAALAKRRSITRSALPSRIRSAASG